MLHVGSVVIYLEPELPARLVERTVVRFSMRVVFFIEVFELRDRLQGLRFVSVR
jgi:hypothetical protein